jgi:hypothetical protein
MIVVLTVMSSIDPHMIRETLGWFVWELGVNQSYVSRSNCCSGLCGRFDVAFRGEELLA